MYALGFITNSQVSKTLHALISSLLYSPLSPLVLLKGGKVDKVSKTVTLLGAMVEALDKSLNLGAKEIIIKGERGSLRITLEGDKLRYEVGK